ncbi:16S rRNA (adenine(1518)-N(6)/adenine(1519)-N(6))-dimethyltransferase RsmA [Dyadobacter subterraneus]|uniref:Ribosomal RNA small subunit methyltransferase A n=1 Tax=Dyadobacter subterraneus TaxID=2773304 RepID=A0ABR9WFS9_9BACT|nr:16S rRNA (adenine(1518)-N(6)/adenine(1519)-N(6))-dimethyltransferase RsmA [Dyadobacter subterraneus]MBE9464360.1 16S rRNA (adenine(1518)-N(6)/adenine(1519)-N(6))-dimethyltransferase RsmA [Dyadobacter subterraneus]
MNYKNQNDSKVRAKKHLGQHFLKDMNIANKIVDGLSGHGGYSKVLEIGPGMGVLTQFLLQKSAYSTYVIEIDTESVAYLKKHYEELTPRIIEGDFLKYDTSEVFPEPFAIIGNFPYNISSQIFFKVLQNPDQVTEVVCMLQKEVAQRIASPPGNKDYGILSVLLQAFYDITYLVSVPPGAFDPPPKVQSGVIRLARNATKSLACDQKLFFRVVKTAFNQRRKTLRNALKPIGEMPEHLLLTKRAEQLSVADFVELTILAETVIKENQQKNNLSEESF